MRRPFVKHPVQHASTASVSHKFTVVTDKAARWDLRNNAGFADTGRLHFGQRTATRTGRRAVQIPVVLGNPEGESVTLSLTIQLDPLLDRGEE